MEELVADRGAHREGGVAALVVVLLDPGRQPVASLGLGGEVLELAEFELRQLVHFATKAQARRQLATWIEEYNHERRHSSLAMRSPIDYELALNAADLDPVQEPAA